MLHIAGGYSAGGLHVTVLHAAGRVTPGVLELLTNQFFLFVLAAGERGWRSRPRVTYGFAAHQRAQHIEVVGVGHVPHPRGHPPAEGGVHEFNKLFVERGSQEVHLRLDVRERERARGGSSRN